MYASKWRIQLVSPNGDVVCHKEWYDGSTTPAQSWAMGVSYRHLINKFLSGKLCMGDYPVLHSPDMLIQTKTFQFHPYRLTWANNHPSDPNPFLGAGDGFVLWKERHLGHGDYIKVFSESLPSDWFSLSTEYQYQKLEELGDIPDFEVPGVVLIN